MPLSIGAGGTTQRLMRRGSPTRRCEHTGDVLRRRPPADCSTGFLQNGPTLNANPEGFSNSKAVVARNRRSERP